MPIDDTFKRLMLLVALIFFGVSISMICKHLEMPTGSTDSDIDHLPPARLAKLGKRIPPQLVGRPKPIQLTPLKTVKGAVTDEQLFAALSSALPLWYPPTVPGLFHELMLWGPSTKFDASLVGHTWSGQRAKDILLSDELCRACTVQLGGEYLIDSPYGIHVVKLGSVDSEASRGEAHHGQLLKILAEAGVPISSPVTTASGRVGTVQELLQDTTLRFSLDRENEFMATALALWLPPTNHWNDEHGTSHTFDELLRKLITRRQGEGSCGGCHIPYAVVVLLRVDQEHHILSAESRTHACEWLSELTRLLTRTRRDVGGWDGSWAGVVNGKDVGVYGGNEVLARITITGHHLEWIALAPPELRPSDDIVADAVVALVYDLDQLPDWGRQSFKVLLPCSHAARALCLLKGVEPSAAWQSLFTSGRAFRTRKGYRLSGP